VAGAGGVLLGVFVAALIRLALEQVGWLSQADADPIFTAFVTAGVAGGAAGLTYTNLLYKRAESARGERAMHEETLRVASELVDSEEELKVISGAKLLAGVIEMSPTHAQTAADILCARLRRRFDPSIDTDELEQYGEDAIRRYEGDRRIRNAIAASIASVTHEDGLAPHVVDLKWRFTDVEFGTKTSFDGCVFGDGTTFIRTAFGSETSFRGAWFLGRIGFERVEAPWGIEMGGCHAEVGLDLFQSDIGTMVDGSGSGLGLEGAKLCWLTLEGVKSTGPISINDAQVVGDLRVSDSRASYFSLMDAQCDREVVINGLRTDDYLCVRNLDVRKGLSITDCDVGGELEITGVRTDGAIERDPNRYGSIKTDI